MSWALIEGVAVKMSQGRGAEALGRVEQYWNALRQGEDVPLRAAFNPSDLMADLGTVLLLERTHVGVVRIRLAGSEICDVMGMELKGMPMTALVAPAGRARVVSVMEEAMNCPSRVLIKMGYEAGLLPSVASAQLLLLPMRGQSGAVDRLLGCLAFPESALPKPRRFVVQSVDVQPVGAIEKARFEPMSLPVAAGLSEAPAAFDYPPKGKGFLRLVKR